MGIEYRTLADLEWRVDDAADGTFEGRACTYGKVDSYGTTFHPKSFRKGGLKGGYALLFMHNPERPIGTFRAEERDDGLYIAGAFDATAAGADARAMARSGSAPELSVGFVRTDLPDYKKLAEMSEDEYKETVRNIKGARLVEVSQITARMASVPGSKLTTVRAALDAVYDVEDGPDLEVLEVERAARAAELERRRTAARARLVTSVPHM